MVSTEKNAKQVAVHFSPQMLEQIEALRAKRGLVSQAEAIRLAACEGLQRLGAS